MPAEIFEMEPKQEEAIVNLPPFLQREETAAQIVALMQAKFTRPGPQEMRKILKCAEQQITTLLP
jgi:hypothetical protein